MFASQPVLHALPVTSHAGRETRMSPTDLMRFEALLDATDSAVASCMEARALAERRMDEPSQEGFECSGVLDATVEAIMAVTGARHPNPQQSLTRAEATKWTIEAITQMRDTAVRDATRHNLAPGVEPAHIAKCMDLISALHERLGGC